MPEKMVEKESEIYIHIPFCEKKCDYCDFLSFPSDDTKKEAYLNVLLSELKAKAKSLTDYQITSVFFGGGTPSSIDSKYIVEIMGILYKDYNLKSNCEITLEVNPGVISEKKLKDYLVSGINRLSFGLQSANNKELLKLGRIHTFEDFQENYHLARKVGFSNINVDLMWGIPEQTLESYQMTLNQILKLEPEHISAYSLIIEEETPFYEKYIEKEEETLPEEEDERKMYECTKVNLAAKGYHQYEISNYGKEGFFCQHNIGYWKRKNYLGFGLGASSLFENRRWKNEVDMEAYINSGKEGFLEFESENLSLNSQMEEFMFLGLRMIEGVSKQEFFRLFQEDMEKIYRKPIEEGKKEHLLMEKGDMLQLTKRGIELSNRVLADFLL